MELNNGSLIGKGKTMDNGFAILLMSHGDFAKEAMKSAELVFGRQENYATVSVVLADQIDLLKQEMLDKIDQLDTSNGLLVFTDIVGGTPMNLAGNLLGRENTVVCSGLNLPMLIEALVNRQNQVMNLPDILKHAYSMGMVIRTELAPEKEDDDDLL